MTYVNKNNNKIIRIKVAVSLILFSFVLSACNTTGTKEDPLKNTRKLIKQGHASLYNNGAFKVPNTEIKLIPAGDSAQQVAFEMMGMKARQSFLTSIKNAADSVYLVPTGSQLSLDYAKTIRNSGEQLGEAGRLLGGDSIARDRQPGRKTFNNRYQAGAMRLTGC